MNRGSSLNHGTTILSQYDHIINCNRHCTVNTVKRYQFQYKMFVGFVWLTSNHMFGLGNLGDKTPS